MRQIENFSEAMGCCHQNISNCLRGKAKTACGYHWEVC